MRFVFFVLFILCIVYGAGFAQGGPDPNAVTLYSLFEVEGTEELREELGTFVKGVGDINRDGYMDVAVSAPRLHETRIYFCGDTIDTTNYVRLHGGGPMASGDLNGDKFIDIAVKNWYEADDTVFIYFGNDTNIDIIAGLVLVQENRSDAYASNMCVGDINGDDMNDLIIGAPFYPHRTYSSPGKVYIYEGGPQTDTNPEHTAIGDSVLYGLGWDCAVGDLNGDGEKDLIILGYNNVGFDDERYVKIYYGGIEFNLDSVCVFFKEEKTQFGARGDIISFDVSGDNIDDLIFAQRDGVIYIWEGGEDFSSKDFSREGADYAIDAPEDAGGFGYALANAGDMNGDGYNDLFVGAPLQGIGTYDGLVLLYSGGAALDDKFDGARVLQFHDGQFGRSVDGVGDMNGDGLSDIVSGGPTYSLARPNRGVFVVMKGDTTIPHTPTTDVDDHPVSALPESFKLFQNFPNPFNSSTDIRYQIPALSRDRVGIGNGRSYQHTTLKIYNILGQEIKTLVDEIEQPGYYTVSWDGRDNTGRGLSSGVYFYQLRCGSESQVRRILFFK